MQLSGALRILYSPLLLRGEDTRAARTPSLPGAIWTKKVAKFRGRHQTNYPPLGTCRRPRNSLRSSSLRRQIQHCGSAQRANSRRFVLISSSRSEHRGYKVMSGLSTEASPPNGPVKVSVHCRIISRFLPTLHFNALNMPNLFFIFCLYFLYFFLWVMRLISNTHAHINCYTQFL